MPGASFLKPFSTLLGFQSKTVLRSLRRLATERRPVRVELENTEISFFTILDIRREKVMLSRPPGLAAQIKAGSTVRFHLPDDRKKAIRLKVLVANFQMARGGPVFLCEIPTEFAPPSKRSSDRFNTSRFKNLRLILSEQRLAMRIVDVSENGCKVYYRSEVEPDWFTSGESIPEARIEIDNRVKMELASVMPRSWTRKTLGFQFQVSQQDNAIKIFAKFLQALEKAEHDRLSLQAG